MRLTALLQPDQVFALRASSKEAVLADLSRRAASRLGVAPAAIAGAVAARERLGSTGVGGGIALPHARLDGMDAPAGFFARLARPIDWAAIDSRPVDLVFLLLSPSQADADHLAALAAVTRRLRQPLVAMALRAATEPRELLRALAERNDADQA